MAKIVDGKVIASRIHSEVETEISTLRRVFGLKFGLAVMVVGVSDAGKAYVNFKRHACSKLGIGFEEHHFDSLSTTKDLVECIRGLNVRNGITGILVQLPLPSFLDGTKIFSLINKNKDVDCLNPENFGKLASPLFDKNKDFTPCTALAVLEILEEVGVNLEGKHVVILGRSNIIGKPLALLLLNKNATVTVCHSKSKGLGDICKSADILISATGVSKLVTGVMVKPGSVVIDAGISRGSDGKICGDIDFSSVFNVASCVSPVPGGVGPVTVAMLLKNIILAAKRSSNLVGN